jgi:ribonuclease P protein component
VKKINIVKESKDFEKAIHKGKFYKNQLYIIYIINNDNNYYRFGISVGKKISNKAIERNKLKRQLKNIIDKNKNLYQNNQDYIIIMKRSCLEKNYQELENGFLDIINKINEKRRNQ